MSSILGKLFVLMALFPHELIARVQKGAETTLVRRALGQASAQSIRDDKPTFYEQVTSVKGLFFFLHRAFAFVVALGSVALHRVYIRTLDELS